MSAQRGFTVLDLMVAVVIIGVLSMIAMTEYNKVHNRAYVGAAVNDVQVVRKALAMYDAEWGAFPQQPYQDVFQLITDLVDPDGQLYMDPPAGDNFASFDYFPPDPTDVYGDYEIVVVCNDNHATQVSVSGSDEVHIVRLN